MNWTTKQKNNNNQKCYINFPGRTKEIDRNDKTTLKPLPYTVKFGTLLLRLICEESKHQIEFVKDGTRRERKMASLIRE